VNVLKMTLRQITVSKASMPAGWTQAVHSNGHVGRIAYDSPAVRDLLIRARFMTSTGLIYDSIVAVPARGARMTGERFSRRGYTFEGSVTGVISVMSTFAAPNVYF
jgi:hypothetical protein